MKLSHREKERLLARGPRVEDVMNSLEGTGKLPRRIYRETRTAVAVARKFCDEVVRPACLEIDIAAHRDGDYLPREFIAEAGRRGFYTLWIPKIFGGRGMDPIALYPFLEEIASVCVGLANVIGVHYLGVGTLCAAWNIPLMKRVLGDVCRGERCGEPCLLSLAITEPEAGTDVEETLLLDRARVGAIARRADGGYVLNGRKVFISNGHVSAWHMVIAYMDRKNPVETSVQAAVKTGTPGFSFGRHEDKMGQKACVASELVFEDCFVPDELICSSPEQFRGLSRTPRQLTQLVIDFVVSSSRTGVGAFAAGAARGAYETALRYARGKTVGGEPLADRQWAQSILAGMYRNVNTARALYMESACANALKGMYKLMYSRRLYYFMDLMPRWYFALFVSPFMGLGLMTRLFRKVYFEDYTVQEAEASSGWASLVKFAASDLAMENANLALDLMGADGLRHDNGVEKFFRDARLLQIYEGTNQLNRINLFKNLIARDAPGVKVF